MTKNRLSAIKPDQRFFSMQIRWYDLYRGTDSPTAAVAIFIVRSDLQTILNAVMYVFARDGRVPEGSSAGQLKEAMRQL